MCFSWHWLWACCSGRPLPIFLCLQSIFTPIFLLAEYRPADAEPHTLLTGLLLRPQACSPAGTSRPCPTRPTALPPSAPTPPHSLLCSRVRALSEKSPGGHPDPTAHRAGNPSRSPGTSRPGARCASWTALGSASPEFPSRAISRSGWQEGPETPCQILSRPGQLLDTVGCQGGAQPPPHERINPRSKPISLPGPKQSSLPPTRAWEVRGGRLLLQSPCKLQALHLAIRRDFPSVRPPRLPENN